MKFERISKKFAAVGLSLAMTFCGMAFVPDQAQATVTPSVTVKGATLRLDATTGTQSMRVALEVKGVSSLASCSMTITNATDATKSVTISTADGTNNKIYDYDETSDTLLYTAVIKDIPAKYFGTGFKVTGSATALASADTKYDTATAVEKSVNGVVEAMGNGTKLTSDGVLVKEVAALDLSLGSSIPDAGSSVLGFSKTAGVVPTYDNNELTVTQVGNDATGICYKFGKADGSEYVLLATATPTTGSDLKFVKYGTEMVASTGGQNKETTLEYKVTPADWDPFTLTTNYNGTAFKLKSFTVNKVLAASDVADGKIDRAITYDINKKVTYASGTSAYAGNLGSELGKTITINSTDTVTALLEITDADLKVSTISMQVYLCTGSNLFNTRAIGNSSVTSGVSAKLSEIVDGVTLPVTVTHFYTNNSKAIGDSDVTVTLKSITVTPA